MISLSLALNEDQVKCEFKSWICLISSDKDCHPIKDQTNSSKCLGDGNVIWTIKQQFPSELSLLATLFSRKRRASQWIHTKLKGPNDICSLCHSLLVSKIATAFLNRNFSFFFTFIFDSFRFSLSHVFNNKILCSSIFWRVLILVLSYILHKLRSTLF